MHEALFSRLGGLSLPRKSVVRITDRPDMTIAVYRGRKTTTQEPVSTSPLMLLLSIFCTVIGFVRLFIDLQADSKCFSHDSNYKFYLLRHILNFVGIILSTISAGYYFHKLCFVVFRVL